MEACSSASSSALCVCVGWRLSLSRRRIRLDRVFAQAFPQLSKADRGRMLAAWSDITGAMIASLDRSKPGERGKLLEELKTILSAYLDAKLAGLN